MHFLLIYLPTPSLFIESKQKFYGISPPQGLLSIAIIIEEDNNRVTILDFSAEPYSNRKILDILNTIDIVGVTTLTLSYPQVKHIVDLIKKIYSRHASYIRMTTLYNLSRKNTVGNKSGYKCIR